MLFGKTTHHKVLMGKSFGSVIGSVLSRLQGNSLANWVSSRWTKGDALEASRRCFIDWCDSRGGGEAGEVQAAISKVRLFIERDGILGSSLSVHRIVPYTIAPDGGGATARTVNG